MGQEKARKILITPGVDSSTGSYSPGLTVGEWVFVSGQGPLQPGTDEIVGKTIAEQTRKTLENVRDVLQAAGCEMDDCVKVTAYLSDIEDFDEYDAVYRTFFTKPYPTRCTVQVALGDIMVEIDAIALRGCGAKKEA